MVTQSNQCFKKINLSRTPKMIRERVKAEEHTQKLWQLWGAGLSIRCNPAVNCWPSVLLQSMGSQRVGHDYVTELVCLAQAGVCASVLLSWFVLPFPPPPPVSTICKIDSQWEFAACLRKLKQGLCINLEGWNGEGDGRGFRRERIYVYLWLIHVEVWQETIL